jgi:hypothetical protein
LAPARVGLPTVAGEPVAGVEPLDLMEGHLSDEPGAVGGPVDGVVVDHN